MIVRFGVELFTYAQFVLPAEAPKALMAPIAFAVLVPPVAEEPLPVIKVPELVIDIAFKIVFEATEGIETVAIPLEFKVTFCDELPFIL